jgi:hypothetical protein
MCLPLDSASDIARHQTPGKLTEALALELPVLARETPPLAPFAARGLIHTIGDTTLAQRIGELLDPANDDVRAARRRGREYFLTRMSHAAGVRTFEALAAELAPGRRRPPERWRQAHRLAREPAGGRRRPGRPRRRALGPRAAPRVSDPIRWDVAMFGPPARDGAGGRRCAMMSRQLSRAGWTRQVVRFEHPDGRAGPARPPGLGRPAPHRFIAASPSAGRRWGGRCCPSPASTSAT